MMPQKDVKRLELDTKVMALQLNELKAQQRENMISTKPRTFWQSSTSAAYSAPMPQKITGNKKLKVLKNIPNVQPLNKINRQPERNAGKRVSGPSCGQCNARNVHVKCQECCELYCAACFAAFHTRGALRRHRTIPMQIAKFTESPKQPASISIAADAPFLKATVSLGRPGSGKMTISNCPSQEPLEMQAQTAGNFEKAGSNKLCHNSNVNSQDCASAVHGLSNKSDSWKHESAGSNSPSKVCFDSMSAERSKNGKLHTLQTVEAASTTKLNNKTMLHQEQPLQSENITDTQSHHGATTTEKNLWGQHNETEEAAKFKEAVEEWRTKQLSGTAKDKSHSTATQLNSAKLPADKLEIEINFSNSHITYAEKLLLKKSQKETKNDSNELCNCTGTATGINDSQQLTGAQRIDLASNESELNNRKAHEQHLVKLILDNINGSDGMSKEKSPSKEESPSEEESLSIESSFQTAKNLSISSPRSTTPHSARRQQLNNRIYRLSPRSWRPQQALACEKESVTKIQIEVGQALNKMLEDTKSELDLTEDANSSKSIKQPQFLRESLMDDFEEIESNLVNMSS